MQRVARTSLGAACRRSVALHCQNLGPTAAFFSDAIAPISSLGASSSSGHAVPRAHGGVIRKRSLSSAVVLDDEDGGAHVGDDREAGTRPRRRPLRERPAIITLTDRAVEHLHHLLASKPDKVGIRLGVRRRGCNGMSYTLKYADEKPKGDEEIVVRPNLVTDDYAGGEARRPGATMPRSVVPGSDSDLKLFVDPMATLYIAGTVMDWEETELSSEFTFRNPNAKGECGCGESFNV